MAPSVQRAVSLLSAVLLLINTVAGQVVDAATPSKQYPYRYNNVAVTGGGFLTGFVAHPTAKNLIYVRTDIGSSYKWDDANDIWVPLTDFISEFNYFGTESIALDPTDANRLYLAQGQYHTVGQAFPRCRLQNTHYKQGTCRFLHLEQPRRQLLGPSSALCNGLQ